MEEHTQDSTNTNGTTTPLPNTTSASAVESKPLSHNESQEVSIYKNRNDLEYKHHGGNEVTSESSNALSFNLPTYGYDQYVMDIANWQRQRVSMGAEPGYYFFKIFFNFNTNYGLLGGLMSSVGETDNDSVLTSKNTAFGYLKTVVAVHKYDNVKERMLALSKFAISLKDISLRTPWLFKTLSGLNTINSTYVNNFDKEKIITIGCGQETVDSRIGTMMDLYKFACFDQVNCKEIVPANLRKFEMSIIVYHMPLSAYHRKVITLNGDKLPQFERDSTENRYKFTQGEGNTIIDSKNMYDKDNFSNMMSFKLFTFLNCEIDCENANEYYTDGMSNEQPFQLGNNQIKIKYDRVYEHRMSEWTQMFFGSDGFYYNKYVPKTLESNVQVGNEIYDFKIQQQNEDDKIDLHKLRLDNLRETYDKSIMNIMDYQKLLINAYYTPFDVNPAKINEVSLSGMQNAYIEKLSRIRNLFIP